MMETERRYRGDRYWERETPEEARSGRVLLRWFRKAGKLQVASLYRDTVSGDVRTGRVVTLDLTDLAHHPDVLRLLHEVVSRWSAAAERLATARDGSGSAAG